VRVCVSAIKLLDYVFEHTHTHTHTHKERDGGTTEIVRLFNFPVLESPLFA